MRLYLVQHAEAKSKEEDPDRSLTDRGVADIEKVASYVAARAAMKVDQFWDSGKTRARQTAEVLAGALEAAGSVKEDDNLGALADPMIWAKKLADSQENLMLVGHLPYMSRLAALLICGDPDRAVVDFQNAGVVCLARDDADSWSVRWIITPQLV